METRTLPRYQSHKHVAALKIQHVTLLPGDAPNDVIAHVFFEDESYPPIHVPLLGKPTPHKGWYYVIYDAIADDRLPYASFSPPEAFEKGYTPVPVELGDIGWAVTQLRNGEAVRRVSWSKGQFLRLCQDAKVFHRGEEITIHPFVAIVTVQGTLVPWAASQTDLLATDWVNAT